jgi:hypothetical protein
MPESSPGTPTKTPSAGTYAMKALKDIPAVADMILGIPGMGLQVGAEAAGRIHGALSGQDRKGTDAYGVAARESVPEGFTQPLQTLLKAVGLDSSGSNVEDIMGKAMGLISQGGAAVEKATKGKVTQADTEMIANGLMFALGTKGVKGQVKGALEPKPPEGQFKEPYKGKLDPPNPHDARTNPQADPIDHGEWLQKRIDDKVASASERTLSAEDARLNAQQRAYDLMQKGASKKEVEGAIKRDGTGMLAQEMEALRERRGMVKESRLGTVLQFGPDDVVGPKPEPGQPLVEGKVAAPSAERGVATRGEMKAGPYLLPAAVAATGLGLAVAYSDGDKKDLASAAMLGGAVLMGKGSGLTLERIAEHGDAAPLKTFLDESAYTLNTLEMLPQNKYSFSKDSINQLLKRQEVTQAERDVITNAMNLGDPAAKDISAKDLMMGIKIETGDWELKKAPTDHFADYGLDAIDRSIADPNEWVPELTRAERAEAEAELPVYQQRAAAGPEASFDDWPHNARQAATALRETQERLGVVPPPESGVPKATTSVWQLPEHMTMSTANHFSDPNYFAHTRSFEEGGVKHVVEIQSDLAQKAGKVLTEEERGGLRDALSNVTQQMEVVLGFQDSYLTPFTYGYEGGVRKLLAKLENYNPDVQMILGSKIQENIARTQRKSVDYSHVTTDRNYPEQALQDALHAADTGDSGILTEVNAAIKDYARGLQVLEQEHRTKLEMGSVSSQVGPLLKNWYKRLVREELADSARAVEQADRHYEQGDADVWKGQTGARPKSVVRFATADTVAKVEGWPDSGEARRTQLAGAHERLASAKTNVETLETMKRGEAPKDAYYSALKIADPEAYARVIKHIDAEISYAQETLRESQAQFDRTSTNWGEQTRFRPEHQGIYDRYKKDVEKFLNQLGGKPHTDSAGHTWIEVPTGGSPKLKAGPRTQMFGGADTKMMAGLAAVGLGAVVGMNLNKDSPIMGAILGATAGAGLLHAKRTGLLTIAAVKNLTKDTRLRIGEEANARDYVAQAFNVDAYRLGNAILDKLPDPAKLAEVWRAVEAGTVGRLSSVQQEVARDLRSYYNKMDEAAKAAGIYKEGRENYLARLLDLDPKNSEFKLAQLFEKTGKNGGNPFGKERKYLTLEDAKKAGYTPVTENPVEMLQMYAHSMGKAIADRNMIRALGEKAIPLSKDAFYIMPEAKAPRSYITIDRGVLRGKAVHPDIVGSLKFMFEARTPEGLMRAIETVNATTKRIAVMTSLFHAKSLLDAAVGAANLNKKYLIGGAAIGAAAGLAGGDPVLGGQLGAGAGMFAAVGKTGGLALRGTLSHLEELKHGGQSGVIERAMKGGLEFSMEQHPANMGDVGGGTFYAAMQDAATLLDKSVPGLGKQTMGRLIKVNQVFDNLMWARLHTGLKLAVFDEKFNTIKENNVKAHEKAPGRVKLLSEAEIAHIAASFSNDAFGGLNWRRIAESAKTKWARDLAENTLSPNGRRGMQLLMFAPDWTISTTRAFLGAFGEGSNLKGLVSPRELADLHRQYILRSAFFYAMAGDGLNYAMSGHHLWDNKDWTRLELGDGRTMQFSKHMMEPYHWMTHPTQQAMNKLSTPIKELANQALGTEYLSPYKNKQGQIVAGPAMKDSHVEHAMKAVTPIASQQSTNTGSWAGGLSGFAGFPIYGQTPEQKEEEKRRKRLQQLMEHK